MKKLILYVDGASRGNPGPASYGVCVFDEEGRPVREASEYLGTATNSVAEYRALIRGLEEARRLGASCAEVFTDSELVARQFEGTYRVKHEGLKELMSRVRALASAFSSVTVRHIPRSSHPGNKRADRLANIALNQAASKTPSIL